MGASIYIADDEKNIRDLITKFLESDGYSVTAFETGDELMEEFLKKPCELVILDIMMPGTDGLTICRRLRTITDVPIIMLTAKDSEYDYVRGITLGGDDYLTKPFRLTTLLMRVKSLLRRMDMNTKKVTLLPARLNFLRILRKVSSVTRVSTSVSNPHTPSRISSLENAFFGSFNIYVSILSSVLLKETGLPLQ